MLPFRRSSGRETDAQAALASEESSGEMSKVMSPYEFVDFKERALDASREAWGGIAAELGVLQEPRYIRSISAGISKVWQGQGHQGPVTELERAAQRLSSELSVYSLLMNRHLSSQDLDESADVDNGERVCRHWFTLPNQNISLILSEHNEFFPTQRFFQKQVAIEGRMRSADLRSQAVLGDLIDNYSDRPEELGHLAELYEGGIADIDPRFRELQQIIAVDWHHPDKNKSMLRNYCAQLRRDPRRYLEQFGSQVVGETDNEQLLGLQRMARFAVINANRDEPVTDEAMRDVIVANYDRWDEVEGIKRLFSTFAGMKVSEIEAYLNTIAGPRRAKNIRMHPSQDDIDRLRSNFTISHARDRGTRRSEARQFARASNADVLPSVGDISRTAANAEVKEPPKRNITITKAQLGGDTELVEIAPGDVAAYFKMDKTDRQALDIRKIMIWLQGNPVSDASTLLEGTKSIRVDSKAHRVWSLAVEKIPSGEVSVHSDVERIVYAVTRKSVAILDVTTHEGYNKKWAKGGR